jgi:hypothetical protein
MIFSTIFAVVRTFASLLTQLSGLAIAGPFFPFFASGRSQDAKGEPGGVEESTQQRMRHMFCSNCLAFNDFTECPLSKINHPDRAIVPNHL